MYHPKSETRQPRPVFPSPSRLIKANDEIFKRRGRARHSVRAVMANPNVCVSRRHHGQSGSSGWPAAAGRGLPAPSWWLRRLGHRPPTPPRAPPLRHWMLGVRCWMLDVGCLNLKSPSPFAPRRLCAFALNPLQSRLIKAAAHFFKKHKHINQNQHL